MISGATVHPRADASPWWRSTSFVFTVVLAVYVVVTLSLIDRYKYSLYPDATSYLSVARAYARGQFWDAVNGYWSPLYCWLLAPLLAAGIDVLLAPKLLALFVGALTLAGMRRLAHRLALDNDAINIVLIAILPSLVCWSLTYVTSDFLLVGVLTWYLSETVGWTPSAGARAGLAAGVLAGTASLAKQYALPYVAAHLVLTSTVHYIQHRTPDARAVIRRWLIVAYVALFAIAGPWIAAMSAKYRHMTIAASGTYNWYLLSTGFNVGTRELAPPPFDGAVSAWVDPTPYAQSAASRIKPAEAVPQPGPGPSTSIGLRAQRFAVMLEQFSLLAIPIVAVAGILAFRDARQHNDYRYLQLGIALGLYIGGYQIVTAWFVERLFWIVPILLAVLGGVVFQRLAASWSLRPAAWLAAAALVAISFWPLPARRLNQGLDDGRETYQTALELERRGVRGRLASLNRYADSLRVAFFTGSSYYGRLAPPPTIEPLVTELHLYQIDFLLIWAEEYAHESDVLRRELAKRFPDALRGELKEVSALDVRSLGSR
jgi:hypothetical protein